MGKKLIRLFLNTIATLMMLGLIAITIPLTIPRLFGFQLFSVLTGSMEPAYPVGSVVYVKEIDPFAVEIGDPITFRLGSDMELRMTHRVVAIDEELQIFITKGDANETEDEEPVHFGNLIGMPEYCIPKLGEICDYMNTKEGKAIIFFLFAVAFLLFVIAEVIADKKERDVDKRNNGFAIIQIIVILVILFSAFQLFRIFYEYYQGNKEYKEIRSAVLIQDDSGIIESDTKYDDSIDTSYQVDFEELQNKNKDIVAWIKFDVGKIDYPVVQGKDNGYYLDKTFLGETNKAGSIFMEAANNSNFTDAHTILYGHNMKNGSMFGTLKQYKEEDYYKEHSYFTIYMPRMAKRYQIFAVHTVPVSSDVYTIGYEHDEIFEDWVNRIKEQSDYSIDVLVEKEDEMITLSTCSYSDEVRYVIHAKCVNQVSLEK